MSSLARWWWSTACALAILVACLTERPRPGPPLVTVTLDKIHVRSPDTLTGTLRAQDAAGIDSVWITLEFTPQFGTDGLMQTDFQAPFRTFIVTGYSAGTRLALKFGARDLDGFVGERDTFVTVLP